MEGGKKEPLFDFGEGNLMDLISFGVVHPAEIKSLWINSVRKSSNVFFHTKNLNLRNPPWWRAHKKFIFWRPNLMEPNIELLRSVERMDQDCSGLETNSSNQSIFGVVCGDDISHMDRSVLGHQW